MYFDFEPKKIERCLYSITNIYSKEGSFACEDAHTSYLTMSVTKSPSVRKAVTRCSAG